MSKQTKILFLILGWILLFGASTLKAQIVGVWNIKEIGSTVEIFKKGDLFFGKIVGLKQPTDSKTGKPVTDVNNTDPSKRNQPLMGLIMLRDLKFVGNNTWENGLIYCTTSGRSFDCRINQIDKNTLEITGFWGLSFIGKTYVWTRI